MRTDNTTRVPAVIVGGGINGLGVLRSLARARVPVFVVDADASQPAMRSRYGRKLRYANAGRQPVIDALEKLAGELGRERPVLILTQEETVASVSAHRDRLQSLYRFSLPPPAVLTPIMHKDGFRALAEAAGATIPRARRITNAEQIEALRLLQPPLVIKPAIRHAGYSSRFCKAYRAETLDQAQALVRSILPTLPDVVVQEWIEGSDSDIYFCLQYLGGSGGVAASFVGRKIRSWPPRVGGTARCAPAPGAAALATQTTDFFCAVGVTGFAAMEYKRDARSGVFYMVEPTVGRTDYQEEVATLNGINIPLAAYRSELGLPPINATMGGAQRVWRDRAADRRSAAAAAGAAPWQPDGAQIVDALWRVSDPMPAVAPVIDQVARRLRRMVCGPRPVRDAKRLEP